MHCILNKHTSAETWLELQEIFEECVEYSHISKRCFKIQYIEFTFKYQTRLMSRRHVTSIWNHAAEHNLICDETEGLVYSDTHQNCSHRKINSRIFPPAMWREFDNFLQQWLHARVRIFEYYIVPSFSTRFDEHEDTPSSFLPVVNKYTLALVKFQTKLKVSYI